jgi:putative RNA 2'-phosphotransferase
MNKLKQSKYLAYILRHHPEDAGLVLDQNGWVGVDDVLAALQRKDANVTMADLESTVSNCDKQRYTIRDGKIRANQGHSLQVDLQLEAVNPPKTLYHGTKDMFVSSIMEKGLLPGERHHVHLSEDVDTAVIVASRRKGSNVIMIIDTTGMDQKFYRSENGVWLTDHVDPRHITIPTIG